MPEFGWFPRKSFAPGSKFSFQNPQSITCTIEDKVSQHTRRRRVAPQSGESGFKPSSAEATFHVRLDSNGQIAFMRVHMQVPHPGTEYDDIEDRRLQARPCPHPEVQALMDFHNSNASMTPALLGIKEESQGSDGCVPGGYIVFIVFEKVPGVRLADDQSAPYPGFPLHTFFRRFDRKERDEIREQFDKADQELARIDWLHDEPWADHLVWDSDTSKLYFIDFRKAHPACWLGRPQDVVLGANVALATDITPKQYNWELFGLAIRPGNSKDEGNLSKWKL